MDTTMRHGPDINEKLNKMFCKQYNWKNTMKKSSNEDKYTADILQKRYADYKTSVETTLKIIKETGLPIRNQNPPEDITENIVKFLIQNKEKDATVKWAKAVCLNGDLYSDNYDHEYPIEIKALTSDGPSSFGPKKKFGVIYFLDMRGWLNDVFILWKVNVSSNSNEWKQIKMNKTQTNADQCEEGRRPHISWDNIHSQIGEKCVKVYEGTFENIFIEENLTTNNTLTESGTTTDSL
jgi:hypothetical protein